MKARRRKCAEEVGITEEEMYSLQGNLNVIGDETIYL
jgi:hypothetical protein